MNDKLVTANLADLTSIFDPEAQEQELAGDARILYTFNNDHSPVRNRVSDNFILDVASPKLSFFVSSPLDLDIAEGTILFATPVEGLPREYIISEISQLVDDTTIALGLSSDSAVLQALS